MSCMAVVAVAPFAAAQSVNPISRMARLVSSDLVMMEDRLSWLEERVATMAQFNEYSLRSGIGARGYRPAPDAPDPYVILDLGEVHVLSRIFLVPSQRESAEDQGIFPRLFTLEVSIDEAFENAGVVHAPGRVDFQNPQNRPIPFAVDEMPARFIRLTVHRGHHHQGWLDQFGLSEMIAMAGDDVVSFGAGVTMSDSLSSGNNWYPQALTDGRMPHGIWHSGISSENSGDRVLVEEDSQIVCWQIDFDEPHPVNRLVLFPYNLNKSLESYAMSNRLEVEVWKSAERGWESKLEWQNRPESASCVTPLVLPMGGESIKRIRMTSSVPWRLGDLNVHALSELEVWSDGKNIARGRPVFRSIDGEWVEVTSVTDGFTSEYLVANVGVWLDQLHERLRFENELAELRPRIRTLESESELNVSFASAVVIAFTFMIPVLWFEQRRLKAKRRLDTLRKRIAADLHDDIGGNLGSISLIARSARRGLEKLPAAAVITHDLEEVELIARQSSMSMRDIVWLIEQRDDSVGDLVHRMEEACERMLREVEHRFDCKSARINSRMSLDFKRHFFLFFKEALHNALKHSKARRVTVLLDDEGANLVLEVQDDGVGMPQETADHPETSRKLRERAKLLGGEISIFSAVKKGTHIRLSVPAKRLKAMLPDP